MKTKKHYEIVYSFATDRCVYTLRDRYSTFLIAKLWFFVRKHQKGVDNIQLKIVLGYDD